MLNPAINPLYRVDGHAGKWILKKEAPDSTGRFSSAGDTYLPDTLSVELPSLDSKALLDLKKLNPQAFEDLARKLILVDVPERFR
jgi:hypothetical protein